jgi:hypothetical protein
VQALRNNGNDERSREVAQHHEREQVTRGLGRGTPVAEDRGQPGQRGEVQQALQSQERGDLPRQRVPVDRDTAALGRDRRLDPVLTTGTWALRSISPSGDVQSRVGYPAGTVGCIIGGSQLEPAREPLWQCGAANPQFQAGLWIAGAI